MKLLQKITIPIAAFFLCLISTGISYASTITVDTVGKSVKSDVDTLDASKGLRVINEQVGIFVKNVIDEPQAFMLKLIGLKDQNYDIYLNHTFIGTKPAKELIAGYEIKVDGGITDPGMMRCLNIVKDRVDQEKNKLQSSRSEEAQRVCWTLGQASSWTHIAVTRDQAWRSVSIIIAPSGAMLQSMNWLTRSNDFETANAVTSACWHLQQARDKMYHVIKDADLRNNAVVAMTPVEFSADYVIKNGKPHISVKLVNNCDLPVSGNISMAIPKGWKTTAKNLKINSVKSGETFNLSFDLTAPSKKSIDPDKMPIAANLTIIQDDLTAGFKLKVTAAKAIK